MCVCVAHVSALCVFVLASVSAAAVVGPGGSCCFESAQRVVATSALSG